MAASNKPINGTRYIVEISTDGGSTWTGIAYAENASLSRAKDVRDVTNKYSGGYRELGTGGKKSWSMTSDGFVVYADDDSRLCADDLHGFWEQSALLDFRFTDADENAGDVRYSGKGVLTAFDESGGTEDNLTYSITIEGSGPLTDAVIS